MNAIRMTSRRLWSDIITHIYYFYSTKCRLSPQISYKYPYNDLERLLSKIIGLIYTLVAYVILAGKSFSMPSCQTIVCCDVKLYTLVNLVTKTGQMVKKRFHKWKYNFQIRSWLKEIISKENQVKKVKLQIRRLVASLPKMPYIRRGQSRERQSYSPPLLSLVSVPLPPLSLLCFLFLLLVTVVTASYYGYCFLLL